MDKTTLQERATWLKGAAAMGGFVISMEQAERSVLRSEEDKEKGLSLTFEQARREVREINRAVLNREP